MSSNIPTKKKIPIQSRPYLFKDSVTGSILSHDQSSYSNVLRARKNRKNQNDELVLLKNMIEDLQQKLK